MEKAFKNLCVLRELRGELDGKPMELEICGSAKVLQGEPCLI